MKQSRRSDRSFRTAASCTTLFLATTGGGFAQAQTKAAAPTTARPVAFMRGGGVWVADVNGKNARLLAPNAAAPSWSPDGTRIAWARDGNVYVSDARGKNIRQATFWPASLANTRDDEDDGKRAITGISWSGRDNALTFAREAHYQIESADTDPPLRFENGGEVTTRHFRATTSALYQVAVPPLVRAPAKTAPTPAPITLLRDIGTGGMAGFMFSEYACPAWSPSGKYLAFVVNGDVWISVRGDRKRDENNKPFVPVRWEWDTRRLAAVAVYDAPNYRGSRANRGVTTLSWKPGSDNQLLYGLQRLDGSGLAQARLLTVRNGVAVRDAPIPIRDSVAQTLSGDVYAPRFSPNGITIEYSRFGTVRSARPDGTRDRLLLQNADL